MKTRSNAEVLTDAVFDILLLPFGFHFGPHFAPKAITKRPQESLKKQWISIDFQVPPPANVPGWSGGGPGVVPHLVKAAIIEKGLLAPRREAKS